MSNSAVAGGRYDYRINWLVSGWGRGYLRKAAWAALACAVLGVFAAAQAYFGNDGTGIYLAPGLALSVLWLVNGSLGDLSLVGPQSALADDAAKHADQVRRRLKVKLGPTGLWQVSGRSELPLEESVPSDLRYVENWSFALRPAGQAEDLLGAGSQVRQVLGPLVRYSTTAR